MTQFSGILHATHSQDVTVALADDSKVCEKVIGTRTVKRFGAKDSLNFHLSLTFVVSDVAFSLLSAPSQIKEVSH